MRRRVLRSLLRPGLAVAALLCLVAAAATFTGSDAASAEGGDEEYVDVAMALEFRNTSGLEYQHSVGILPPRLTVVVMNHGTLTAYDVEVVVDIVYPKNTVAFYPQFSSKSPVRIGSVSLLDATPAGTDIAQEGAGYSLRWTIPALPGLAYEEFTIRAITSARDTTQTPFVEIFDEDHSPFEFFGEVTTSSFDRHEDNNTDRLWAQATTTNTLNPRHARVKPDYKILSVSVDEPSPSPGGIVNFTFVAEPDANIDSRVAIELTDGLAVDVDADATPAREITTELTKPEHFADTPAPVSYNDGVFTIGTRRYTESVGTLTATMPIRVANDAVVNEQCITVTISGNPPPGPGPYYDDISDNVAELCLGEPPDQTVVLNSGETGLLTWYNCVGRTTYPCSDTDSVEFVVLGGSAALDASLLYPIVKPDRVIVQIPDPSGRATSSEDGSSDLVWSTGYDGDPVIRSGVILGEDLVSLDFSQWGVDSDNDGSRTGTLRVEVSGPGKLSTWATSGNGSAPWEFFGSATNGELTSGSWYLGAATWYAEFSKLGTYRVDFDGAIAKNNGTPTDTTDDTSYSIAKRTYVFHVGPMADLAVEDGGSSAHVAGNRNALTIVAINNGPDTASDAQVTGLPTGAEVLQISKGSYDPGAGVWDIGELKLRGYYDSRGEPAPTLVLAAAAGETASVSIANSTDYEVCIDSSGEDVAAATESICEATTGNTWHSTEYYDYNDDNSTNVTITARRGTKGAVALRTSEDTADVNLSWSPRTGAVGYGIEVSEDDGAAWSLLAWWVGATSYTHTGVPQGAVRHYRVHAIDSESRRSLPFATTSVVAGSATRETSPPGAPEQMTLSAAPSGRSGIVLSWVAPEDYGSPVSDYTLQIADGRSGPWANVSPQPGVGAVSYALEGLEPNTRKYFRIRATNEFGGSLWSAVAEARTAAAGVPGPPRNVLVFPREDAITVVWEAPDEDGGAEITGYETQWSADGSAAGRWSSAGATSFQFVDHSGIGAGATRHYRVRARNARGWGPWSLPPYPSGTTPGAEPLEGQPSLLAEASGQSAVVLSWYPPYDAEGREITRYELQYFEEQGIDCAAASSASKYAALRTFAGSVSSYTHTGLKPSHAYCYRLRAGTAALWSAWATYEVTTEQAGTPSAGSLTVRANGATEIHVSWTRPNDGGSSITGYELEWSEESSPYNWFWVDRNQLPASATSYTDEGLAPGTQRHYRLRAHNANGPGQWSPVRSASTDASGPGVPTGLTATAHATSQQIDLTWVAPADTGGSPITAYWLERSRDGSAPWQRLTSRNGTSWSDTRDLYPGMTRYYRVAAVNRSGAGIWSDPVASDATAIPAGGSAAQAPDPPPALRFTSIGRSQVSFAWDPPPNNGGAPIIRYEYQETLAEENVETTGTTGTIRGLDDELHHYGFQVRAVNAVGAGEWSDSIYTQLWPGRTEQVRVSTTNLTVTEGGTVSFTVSLNQAPPLPMGLSVYPRGTADVAIGGTGDYLDAALIPSGWTHPDGEEWWSLRSYSWSSGVPVSITIPDDDVDNPDRVLVVDISVGVLSAYIVGVTDDEWNARWGIDPDGTTSWDEASWRDFTAPSIRITVRDND